MKEFKSDYKGWPTVRCYPRTLAEAFPKDPQNFVWFHPPESRRGWANAVMLVAGLMLWVGIAYLIAKN